jgi:hypothetical protein
MATFRDARLSGIRFQNAQRSAVAEITPTNSTEIFGFWARLAGPTCRNRKKSVEFVRAADAGRGLRVRRAASGSPGQTGTGQTGTGQTGTGQTGTGQTGTG